jgi:anti-anti-sigma regulatory factor
MVNAGAIACSGLIRQAKGDGAFDYIRQALGRFAGRELGIDEAVYASENATGDRNRAIGYLLRNSTVIKDDVSAVLEVYFRQCSVLVTARDIAIMAATLANRGFNPVTGEQVLTPYAISRTLSVMTSSGMYDYAGEWIYRVGIPAKSGVGGGILAALPARLGLGSYSPRLDSHGNSVRGIKVCEALSLHYDLHMLNRSDDARNSIIADYNIGNSASRRSRRPHEQKILAVHHHDVRIIELVGTLTFANVDYVSRQLATKPRPQFIIFDLRRVAAMTRAGARMLAEAFRELAVFHVTVIISGIKRSSPEWEPRRMGQGHLEFAQLPSARRGHRMGGGPDRLSARRRHRLRGDYRAIRATAAGGIERGRTCAARRAGHDQNLSSGTADHRHSRTGDLAVLSAKRRRPRQTARRHPARDHRRGHGVRGNGAVRGPSFRRRAGRQRRHRPRNPAARFSALSRRASADRRTRHAQSRATARRAPDRGQRQGEFADGELTRASHHFR